MFKHLLRIFTKAGVFKAVNTTQQMTHLIFCQGSCVFITAVVEGKWQDGTDQHLWALRNAMKVPSVCCGTEQPC